jgi:hypothetical protein
MSLKRGSEKDSDVSAKKRAQRIAPTAKKFSAQISLRDTDGIEYALPESTDTNASEIESRFSDAQVYYIRRALRKSRASGARQPTHLRRGSNVRLLDLQTRTEYTATVIDLSLAEGPRSTSGYVVLTMKRGEQQVTDPREFDRRN